MSTTHRRWSAADADALFSSRGYGKPKRREATAPVVPRPAAGILFRYTDSEGAWYLLGQRTARLGGTWANIGGSIDGDETPLAAAMRECDEEISVKAAAFAGATIAAEIQCGTEARPYTMFVVDVLDLIEDAVLGWENDDLAWFHEDEVPFLNLHEGFARGWATLALGEGAL